MQYYSTNKQAPDVTLEEAVVKGLAADKGLFMPFTIKPLPQEFYDSIDTLGFQEIAYRVADAFFGEDVPADTLKQIVYDTLSFDVPLVKVTENIYSLELFHGPTPCELRTHTNEPVPFFIWYPGIEPDEVQTFDEVAACSGSYGLLKEDEFINEFMKG